MKLIDRQNKEDSYDYAAVYSNIAVGKTFKVQGATFTLQLPDGRLVVVNCDSKFAEHMAGRAGNRRSCRAQIVDSEAVIEHIKSCEKCRALFKALADEMDRHAYGFEHRN